ncbi:MAG: hypothetical protein ABI353_16785, partial [Isosphaeraceae bacterium]
HANCQGTKGRTRVHQEGSSIVLRIIVTKVKIAPMGASARWFANRFWQTSRERLGHTSRDHCAE